MATITRTKNFTIGQSVDRQDVADLLEDALVSQIGTSDLTADVILVTAASEAPSAAPGKWWWDMTEQLMKIYDTTHSLWLATGPDRRDIAMQNWTGGTAGRGTVVHYRLGEDNERRVRFSTNSANDSDMALGTFAETTASGAWGPLSIRGAVWMWDDGSPNGGVVNPNDYVRSALSNGRVQKPAGGTPASNSFGLAMQRAGAGDVYLGWWIGGERQASNTT